MQIKVNNWDEIDFSNVDPNLDTFLVNGKEYKMSDQFCHNCWEGGTVVEAEDEFYCLRCQNRLKWYEIEIKFLGEENSERESFLLPVSWNSHDLASWKSEFQERRNIELKFRDFLLKNPEGGDLYDNE